MSDLLDLRARVKAARALAAKAAKRPWNVYEDDDEEWIIARKQQKHGRMTLHTGVAAELRNASVGTAKLMAAAPGLVIQLTEALALAEAQATQLDDVRAALGNGVDERAWPPGFTVPEAVSRMRAAIAEVQEESRAAELHRNLNRRVAAALGLEGMHVDPATGETYLPSWHDMPERVTALVTEVDRLRGAYSAACDRLDGRDRLERTVARIEHWTQRDDVDAGVRCAKKEVRRLLSSTGAHHGNNDSEDDGA